MFAKSLLKPLLLAAALLMLNGCATYALWENHDSSPDYTVSTSTHTENDTVVGFARVKPDSQKLPPNSIVMLGESYIYVMTIKAATLGLEAAKQPGKWIWARF